MNVAVLIPTKNRPDFIERTLAYYDALKSEHPIYIGDASSPEIAARMQAFVRTLAHAKVRYFHWEGVRATETTVKLAQCAQAESAYCALHGDDDYLIPASLSRCAEFLSANVDYRTAQGRAALITLDRPGPYGELRAVVDYWGVNGLDEESGAERFQTFGHKYFISAFSTHRTDEFVRDSEYYAAVSDDSFAELLQCYIFAIRGKSKFLDCLYLIRHDHDSRFHPSVVDWIVRERWSADYHKTVEVVGQALAETDGLPQSEARQAAADTLRMYVSQRLGFGSGVGGGGLLGTVKRLVPLPVKRAIRQMMVPPLAAREMRALASERSRFHHDFAPVVRSFSRR
ncbi:MAG: TIGR00180 family glycosyltransferase [Gemmatimonadaceae bacterium]|nr:TIGR00180 family glycosyltransferase [Gemmatimonadaceae bacterium]